ncbi:MAG: hypothetical protein KDE51_08615 [Anaerolineales bacterium]|nr:hypothetical protein [Anaerolineales bacterium]
MKVVVAGEIPFVTELSKLCRSAGHDTKAYLVEDFFDAIESGYANDLEDVDVLIEIHNESKNAKQELMMGLAGVLSSQALILSSALPTSTTEIASWLHKSERVVGFGLIPPIEAGGVVEIAAGLQTSDAHLQRAKDFWATLGLETVQVKDGPGLVRARTLCCLINEAISALMEGVATAEDIDKAMQLGTNYPRGLLAWADYIGLDAVLGVMTGLFTEWGESRYRPSPLLKRMVLAGKLGQKSGEGFYKYDQ